MACTAHPVLLVHTITIIMGMVADMATADIDKYQKASLILRKLF
jgi:hypothetical protein